MFSILKKYIFLNYYNFTIVHKLTNCNIVDFISIAIAHFKC